MYQNLKSVLPFTWSLRVPASAMTRSCLIWVVCATMFCTKLCFLKERILFNVLINTTKSTYRGCLWNHMKGILRCWELHNQRRRGANRRRGCRGLWPCSPRCWCTNIPAICLIERRIGRPIIEKSLSCHWQIKVLNIFIWPQETRKVWIQKYRKRYGMWCPWHLSFII